MSSTTAHAAYSEAKKALNASQPDRLVCRAHESTELEGYLLECFELKRTLSLYINGQPGTGKTLTVNHTLDSLKQSYKFKQIFVNCMSVKNMQGLYKTLSLELPNSGSESNVSTPSKRNNKENLAKTFEATLMSLKVPVILVLDEVDQIETTIKSASDLYKIFDWPYLPNSKLILIGIANSLDFTDRLLPRLELKPECKPRVIKFLPYSKEDIIAIVKDRLSSVRSLTSATAVNDSSVASPPHPLIDDRALTLCATKIASTTGDIRKVLDICRRAIEVLEQDCKLANQSDQLKTVGIAHMMRIFNEVNPMTNSNLNKNAMPLMQKILLCTILLCTKETNMKDVVLSKLFEKFNKICKAYSTEMDSESEFVNLCTMLQDNSLVDVKKVKDVRNYKISLRIDDGELKDKLQDETFMADILTNKSYR